MARSRKLYEFSVKLSVVNGCFTSEDDLLMYIKFRLGLRSRESDSISLLSVDKVSCSNIQEVLL